MSIWLGSMRHDMPAELQGALDPDHLQRLGLL